MAPQRTCIGCRRRAAASELVRISADGGELRLGRGLPGRGAWLCPRIECLDQAIRRRAIGRALRTEFTAASIDVARLAFVEAVGGARG